MSIYYDNEVPFGIIASNQSAIADFGTTINNGHIRIYANDDGAAPRNAGLVGSIGGPSLYMGTLGQGSNITQDIIITPSNVNITGTLTIRGAIYVDNIQIGGGSNDGSLIGAAGMRSIDGSRYLRFNNDGFCNITDIRLEGALRTDYISSLHSNTVAFLAPADLRVIQSGTGTVNLSGGALSNVSAIVSQVIDMSSCWLSNVSRITAASGSGLDFAVGTLSNVARIEAPLGSAGLDMAGGRLSNLAGFTQAALDFAQGSITNLARLEAPATGLDLAGGRLSNLAGFTQATLDFAAGTISNLARIEAPLGSPGLDLAGNYITNFAGFTQAALDFSAGTISNLARIEAPSSGLDLASGRLSNLAGFTQATLDFAAGTLQNIAKITVPSGAAGLDLAGGRLSNLTGFTQAALDFAEGTVTNLARIEAPAGAAGLDMAGGRLSNLAGFSSATLDFAAGTLSNIAKIAGPASGEINMSRNYLLNLAGFSAGVPLDFSNGTLTAIGDLYVSRIHPGTAGLAHDFSHASLSNLSNVYSSGAIYTDKITTFTGCNIDFDNRNLLNVHDLTITGTLSAVGDFYIFNTTTCNTQQFFIDNAGTGPALIVNQSGHNDIVRVMDDSNTVFFVKDGGQVGIGSFGYTIPGATNGLLHIENPNDGVAHAQTALYVRQSLTSGYHTAIFSGSGGDISLSANGYIGLGSAAGSPGAFLHARAVNGGPSTILAQTPSGNTAFSVSSNGVITVAGTLVSTTGTLDFAGNNLTNIGTISPSGYCNLPSIVNTFNGRAGAVTLTSGDVTGALVYTPLDSANNSANQLIIGAGGTAVTTSANLAWVPGQNMLSGDRAAFSNITVYGAITAIGGYSNLPILVNTFNSRSGAVTLTSGDVTGALTYTPLNSANNSANAIIIGAGGSSVTTSASLSWVPGQNLLSGDRAAFSNIISYGPITAVGGYCNLPTLVNTFNSRSGAVTLTSGDVTGALAYTPLDSANNSANQLIIGAGGSSVTTSAALSWVPGQNLLSGDHAAFSNIISYGPITAIGGYCNLPSIVNTFNSRSGAVTLTSGDVTGALTYTPLDSANNSANQLIIGAGGTAVTTSAALSWVSSQNLLSGNRAAFSNITSYGPITAVGGYCNLPTLVNTFNTRSGAVTLTSGDVTGALTYTPLDSANNSANAIIIGAGGTAVTTSAALSWVPGQNLLSGDHAAFSNITSYGPIIAVGGYCNLPILVNTFNTRSGAVTLTSGDVTGALTYTPLDSANNTANAVIIGAGGTAVTTSAALSWVPGQNLLSGNRAAFSNITSYGPITAVGGYCNLPTLVNTFNTRSGAVTLTSGDVTGALAYTPLDSANNTANAVIIGAGGTAISTSAALSWVPGQNLLSGDRAAFSNITSYGPITAVGGYCNLPTLVNTFNTRSGAVTLTSGDVTGALTYTPLDSANNSANAIIIGAGGTSLTTSAALSWVPGQNLLSGDRAAFSNIIAYGPITAVGGYCNLPTLVNTFNSRSGAVTLTSGDVTGALTYTPLNSANNSANQLIIGAGGTAISTSAALSWVPGQNLLSGDRAAFSNIIAYGPITAVGGYCNLPTLVNTFNTRSGAVTLTSGDVTGALAYTPLNSANNSANAIIIGGSGSSITTSTALSWVPGQNLLSGDRAAFSNIISYGPITAVGGYCNLPTLVNTFNSRSGAVTLSSSDVTTALAYTPLDSTNNSANAIIIGAGGTSVTTSAALSWIPSQNMLSGNRAAFSNIVSYGPITAVGGYCNLPTLVNTFNTRSGAVTLTSGDVTGALAYTPLDSTNNSANAIIIGGSGSSITTSTALSWVPSQNLVSGDRAAFSNIISYGPITAVGGYCNLPSLVNSFNTRTGAVTLTSSDVTGALSYTPLDSANNAANRVLIGGTGSSISTSTSLSWIPSQNLLSGDRAAFSNITSYGPITAVGGYCNLPALVNSFNTRTGAVTLTSNDVTTALGYTPLGGAGFSTGAIPFATAGGSFTSSSNLNWDGSALRVSSLGAPSTNYLSVISGVYITGVNTSLYAAPTNTYGLSPDNTQIGLRVTNNIMAQAYLSVSDRRIKNNITALCASESLATINKIAVYNYQYKAEGPDAKKIPGFIAQEVEEIAPFAVKTTTGAVPSILKMVEPDKNGYYYIGDDAQPGMRVKIFLLDNTERICMVQDNGYINTRTTGKVFIYGEIVDDFKLIENERLLPLAFSAIRELTRRIEILESEKV